MDTESDIDLYDDIFVKRDEGNNSGDLEDLYGNIHNPEVAESAVQKLKTVTSDHEKAKSQILQLKQQISILNDLNRELHTKNVNLEKNFKELVETCRNEINRKNDQIKNLRSELDNLLFKRAGKSMSLRELETLMKKYQLPDEPFRKLPTKSKLNVKIVSQLTPDVNVANRQFTKKRKASGSPVTEPDKKKHRKVLNAEFSDGKKADSVTPVVKNDISLISRYSNIKERKKNTRKTPDGSQESRDVNNKVQKENNSLPSSAISVKSQEKKVENTQDDSIDGSKDISKKWHCELHNIEFRVRSDLRNHVKEFGCKSRHKSGSDNKLVSKSPKNDGKSSTNSDKGASKQTEKHSDLVDNERLNSNTKKLTPSPSEKKDKEKLDRKNTEGIHKTIDDVIKTFSSNKMNNKPDENADDDVLDLRTTETFDDLDFEPDDEESDLGSSVTFKSLNSNFSIPKKKAVESKNKTDDNVHKHDNKRSSRRDVDNHKKDKNESHHRDDKPKTSSKQDSSKISTKDSIRERDRRGRSRERSRRKSGDNKREKHKSRSGDRKRSKSRDRRSSKSRLSERRRSPARKRERTPRRQRSSSQDRNRRKDRRRSGSKSPLSSSKDKNRNKKHVRSDRRSQSLSPERLKTLLDLDNIDIEDEMSLDALEKIKQQLMGKMGLDDDLHPIKKVTENVNNEDIEEGEVSDGANDEHHSLKKKENSPKNSSMVHDLRKKLDLKTADQAKTLPADTSLPDVNKEIKAVLNDYSTDDIEHRLIPFKKRQFHELLHEEQKLKQQIEKSRSKSNTPRRLSECSDINLKSSPPLVIASPANEFDLDDDDDEFDPRRVSPLKLSLKGVVISRPSSSSDTNTNSSSSNSNPCNPNSGLAKPSQKNVEQSSTSVPLKTEILLQDDNAVTPIKATKPPTTPLKKASILDVSRDLTLTDESDIDLSPEKKKISKTKSLKTPPSKKETLSFGIMKKLPLTPKENLNEKPIDISSPQGISSLLKSPLVSPTVLAASSPMSSKLNAPVPARIDENHSASGSASSGVVKKKKRRVQLTRSITSCK